MNHCGIQYLVNKVNIMATKKYFVFALNDDPTTNLPHIWRRFCTGRGGRSNGGEVFSFHELFLEVRQNFTLKIFFNFRAKYFSPSPPPITFSS